MMLARTHPDVMHPVTITVSTRSLCQDRRGVGAEKIDGADFISTTSGLAAAIRGLSSTCSEPASRSLTGGTFQCGAARGLS